MFTLALVISPEGQSNLPAIPDFFAPPVRAASGTEHPGDVLFRRLASELSS